MVNEQTGGLQEQPLPHLCYPQLALALLEINPVCECPSSSSWSVRGNAARPQSTRKLGREHRTRDLLPLAVYLCLMIFDESVRWK
jgi:hypothetical protein